MINHNRYSIFDRTVEKNGLKQMTSVLIGDSRSQQILDNIKAISCAPFTEEELKLIDEISQS